MRRVRVLTAPGCHLCEAALEVINGVRREVSFVLEIVDISRDPDLEARYRAEIPVVEIDGLAAFTYFVPKEAFRDLVSGETSRSGSGPF